jgi:hypothetical protein
VAYSAFELLGLEQWPHVLENSGTQRSLIFAVTHGLHGWKGSKVQYGTAHLLLLRLGPQQRAGENYAFAADGGTVHSGCCTALWGRELNAASYTFVLVTNVR